MTTSSLEPPPLRLRLRLAGLALGVLALGLSALLARAPELCERLYGEGLGPALASPLSRITGRLPFSLAEFLLAALPARQACAAFSGLRRWRRRQASLRRTLLAGLLRLLQDAGWIVFLFYLLWGLHYDRPPLGERWGLPEAQGGPERLAELAEEMLAAANGLYVEIHGRNDAGAPTTLPEGRQELQQALEQGFARLAASEGEPALARRHGTPKRPWIAPLMSRLGISGFYFPWTAEANVNRHLPGVAALHTLAHEMAHQRGIAPEDEANFLGFRAALASDDPHLRYGACMFAQRQLLRALAREDRDRATGLLERRLPGVQRDVDDLVGWWERHRGRATRVARRVNDAYLRSHRVEGGVASYGRSLRLLLAWAELEGGSLLPRPPEGP